jgi:hypothetical protein
MKPKRWQDWGNVVLGVWLVVSPWALGFSDRETASLSAWFAGAAVVVFATIGAYMREAWEEAITVIVGLVLMGAPWAFGFSDQLTATANISTSGLLVIIFAVWAMLRHMDIGELTDEHRQAPGR